MIVEMDVRQTEAVRCALEVRLGHLSGQVPRIDSPQLREQLDEERAVLRSLLRDINDAQRRLRT